jgi:hypothetical protein
VKELHKIELAKWTYLLFHVNFRNTIDNTTTKNILAKRNKNDHVQNIEIF